jgi:hypothetical protein
METPINGEPSTSSTHLLETANSDPSNIPTDLSGAPFAVIESDPGMCFVRYSS